MTELYRPGSGTEGEVFFDNWCRHCSRDRAMREGDDFDDCDDNELCEIIAAGFDEVLARSSFAERFADLVATLRDFNAGA